MARISSDTRLAILDLTRCGWSASRIAVQLEVGVATVKRVRADNRKDSGEQGGVEADLVTTLDEVGDDA